MNRGTIRKRVKQALQDQTNKHWTDREINDYIDDSLKEFVRISKHPHVRLIRILVIVRSQAQL